MVDLLHFVFNFHNAACECNEIVEGGFNPGTVAFVGFVVDVGKTRFEESNFYLELFGEISEGSTRRLFQVVEVIR